MLNSQKIKKDFPIFSHHKKLVYLDSAATTQKPKQVIDAISHHYKTQNANIHRGIYKISEQATKAYENAKIIVAKFIGAPSQKHIIFTKNTTEAINLVAHSFVEKYCKAGDEILISIMEHHANIIPWHIIAKKKKLKLKYIDIKKDGILDIKDLKNKITSRTKLCAITHVSNVLGTINPVKKITRIMHAHNIAVLIDGAQAVPHFPVDVKNLDCDFYAFSGHKMLAPTGIGVLYMHEKYLTTLPPFLGGGEMILSIAQEKLIFQDPPMRFEAGTPPIEAAVGLGKAIDYLLKIGMRTIAVHEMNLCKFAFLELKKIPNITIYGSKEAQKKVGVIAFTLKNIHPHDLASLLNEHDIAIRAGHHCAMPLHKALHISASARMSFYIYTTKNDILTLCKILQKIVKETKKI